MSALGLAPQVTAPPPYGIFHDMRWLFVYNTSWLSFAWETAALVVFRTLLSTLIITLPWPEPDRDHDHDHSRPRLRKMLQANLGFTVTALAVLSPWACISFAVSGTSLSWFVFGEVLEFVILSVVLQRGGIVPRWWLGLPSLRAAGMAPPGSMSDIPVIEEPGTHASLEREPHVQAQVIAFLRGDRVRQRRTTAFTLLRYAAGAWVAPALPLSANPVRGYPGGAPDASFGGPICTGGKDAAMKQPVIPASAPRPAHGVAHGAATRARARGLPARPR